MLYAVFYDITFTECPLEGQLATTKTEAFLTPRLPFAYARSESGSAVKLPK